FRSPPYDKSTKNCYRNSSFLYLRRSPSSLYGDEQGAFAFLKRGGWLMKLIVGLGNPGKQYEKTRHNIGFEVIDELSRRLSISLDQSKFIGLYGSGHVRGEKVFLLKPLTYMNLSGESIRALMDYYEIELEDLIVIYDDLDLPVGKIRLR